MPNAPLFCDWNSIAWHSLRAAKCYTSIARVTHRFSVGHTLDTLQYFLLRSKNAALQHTDVSLCVNNTRPAPAL
jgi:hypothetical protein